MTSAPLLGDPGVIRRYFEFRERVFNSFQNYGMPSFDGMEHDTFDTLATIYFVRLDPDGSVLGSSRPFPTTYAES